MNSKSIIILLLICLFTGQTVFAQEQITVTGTIVDRDNEPLAGVIVQDAGDLKVGVTTDIDGNFTVKVSNANTSLKVTYLGYITQTVPLKGQRSISVILEADSKGLDEVVVVGHGVQRRITMTGAASTISAEEIKRVPSASINNVLAGRLPGVFTQQRSGQPGADAADFFIRGANSLSGDNQPLIVVDDVEYSYEQLAQLSANEIESITILKDASTTAIYGLKGANGVLVITTSRGREGKPTINVTMEGGLNRVIKMPKVLDAYTTASLYNEAQMNDAYGLGEQAALQFSAEDLEFYRNGRDPYGHPNVDWVSELLNRTSNTMRYGIDIQGGNNNVKYFTSLGYYNQDGIMKEFTPIQPTEKSVNPNYYYRRYNFRSNLDFTPTKSTSIRLDLSGRFETQNSPAGALSGSIFDELKNYSLITAYAMPLTLPNGNPSYANHPGAAAGFPGNPVVRYGNSGYNRTYKNNYNIAVNVKQQLDFITQGLSVLGSVSYAAVGQEVRNLIRTASMIPAYTYNPTDDTYLPRSSGSTRWPPYAAGGSDNTSNYTVTYQARANYDRTFAFHHVYAMYLLSRRTYIDQYYLSDNDQSMTWRLGYDFNKKYLFEFNMAYNGNDRFAGDRKFGWFPAVSAGWNLGEESFFQEIFPFINLFKIRGSYGLVGSDASFTKDRNTADVIWSSGMNPWGNTSYEGELVNVDATWEKERKFDVGLDANLFEGKFRLMVDYFYNYRSDQLITFGDVPAIIGQTLPKRNIGESSNRGWDGEFTWRNKAGQLNYSLGGTFSYARNRIEYISEAPAYPYQARSGSRIGLDLGYHCLGFYQLDDFDANGRLKEGIPAPAWASNIQPGDLRYQDMNEDGVIDEADQTYLSKPNLPTCTYGINTGLSWKSWSFNMLWQGSFDYAIANMGGDIIPFTNNLQEIHLDRWTPTNTNARFPRLGITSWDTNNYSTHRSDFWYLDASYIRLRSMELAYQIPQNWLEKTIPAVRALRLYATGYNLLNFSNLNKLGTDPEGVDSTIYPTQSTYMLGVQIGF
jgi:TonB-linked SusC/RagA family outer membrane protein